MEQALESPALKRRSTRTVKFAYPPLWNDRVPLKARMRETVPSDLAFMKDPENALSCIHGEEYYVWVNSYGAVSAILENGERLGLEPGEFEVTEWHNQ